MNNNMKKIAAGLVVVFVGAAGIYLYKNRDTKTVTPPARDEVLEEDLKVLGGAVGSSQYQIYAALVRLAQTGNKVAYEESLKRYKSNDPWIRAGAGMALSYFPSEESDRIIQELANDPDPIVREKTFEGFSLNARTPERQNLVESLISDKKRPAGEIIQLKIGILKQGGEPKVREQLLLEIFALTKELPVEKKIQVVQNLVAAESRNETLGNYLKSLLMTEKGSTDLTAVLVNSLSVAQPDKIRNELPTYIRSEHENIRVAAVNGFLYSCPPGVVTLLGDLVKNDKSELVVRSSLQVLSGFPGEESRKIFQSLQGKKLSPNVEQTYVQAYKAFELNKGSNPCSK
jgi:hypothetical protein